MAYLVEQVGAFNPTQSCYDRSRATSTTFFPNRAPAQTTPGGGSPPFTFVEWDATLSEDIIFTIDPVNKYKLICDRPGTYFIRTSIYRPSSAAPPSVVDLQLWKNLGLPSAKALASYGHRDVDSTLQGSAIQQGYSASAFESFHVGETLSVLIASTGAGIEIQGIPQVGVPDSSAVSVVWLFGDTAPGS